MKNFYLTLEDCLTRLSSGTDNVDECLALYPEHAGELRPLLQSALFLGRGRNVMPLPTFKSYTRFIFLQHAQSQAYKSRSVSYAWKIGMTFALLVAALFVMVTVRAQSALPGDVYYSWKRTSETAWRAVTPDPVAADIAFANRRLNEWIAVANNPALSMGARNDYQEALSKLESADDANTLALIMPMLELHQQLLSDASLSTSKLDAYLLRVKTLSDSKNKGNGDSNAQGRGSNAGAADPCLDDGQIPCGQDYQDTGDPAGGNKNVNCNAVQGEVDPSCTGSDNNNRNSGGSSGGNNGGSSGGNNGGNGGGNNGGNGGGNNGGGSGGNNGGNGGGNGGDNGNGGKKDNQR